MWIANRATGVYVILIQLFTILILELIKMKIKKRLIIILNMLMFLIFSYGEEISLKVITGDNSYKYDRYCEKKETNIKAGTIYNIEGFKVGFYQKPDYSETQDDNYALSYFFKGNPAFVTGNDNLGIEGLIPENTKNLFPVKYISYGNYASEKVYINIDCLDALYKKNKQIVKQSGLNKDFEDIDYFYIGEYLRGNMGTYPIFSNVVLTFYTLQNFLINNISKKNNTTYYVDCFYGGDINDTCEQDYDCHPIFLFERFYNYSNISRGDKLKLKITFDGDYVHFYDLNQNKLLVTHVLIDKEFALKCADFFQDKKVDTSNIIWPRHADGSCDYDGSSTNVTLNKIMTVTENLKLRSGEATTTQVLTVMSVGTKVKILELGKAERIDGINSNWVKVEIQPGAKDRDGKLIKAGTVGWCYGGFLK